MESTKDILIREAVREIDRLPHGERSKAMREWSKHLGISASSLYRRVKANDGGERKARRDRGGEVIPGRNDLVKKVFTRKLLLEKEDGRILSTWIAIKESEQAGEIPPGELSVATANRVARQLGIARGTQCVRIEPEYVNEVSHFDGTGSVYFYMKRGLGDGDFVLGGRLSYQGNEKNRKIRNRRADKSDEGRPLVYLYGAVDGHSRFAAVKAVITPGESLSGSLDFFEGHFRQKAESLWYGIPEQIVTDNGPMGRATPGRTLCERVGIELTTNMPGNKRANGKIERFWRTLWMQFEYPLARQREEVLFSEYRRLLAEYVNFYNRQQSNSVYTEGRSREQMAIDGLRAKPQRILPPGATLSEMAVDVWFATVNQAGCIRKDNRYFEIRNCPATMLKEKVRARMNLNGEVEALNPDTREWLPTRAFKGLKQGDYRAFKKNVNDELRERAEKLAPVDRLYFEGDAASETAGAGVNRGNVVNLSTEREERRKCFASAIQAALYIADAAFGGSLRGLSKDSADKVMQFAEKHWQDRARIEAAVLNFNEMKKREASGG